jgi:hypothetical protein
MRNDKTWRISRRTMLRGMGVAMGLPLLEAMKPLAALAGPSLPNAPGQSPVRFAALYMPNGVNPYDWTPAGSGSAFELSPILQPLASLQREILVLSGLANRATNTGDGHYVKTAAFLTGTTITKTTGSEICSGGVSVDQVAAKRIGNLTRLPSLELGIEPVTTGVDTNVGYTRLYGSHISWMTPTTPLAKEINPRLAFDRVFRSGAARRHSNPDLDRSVLDLVREDAERLKSRIGRADQEKLGEYFESVRAVERRIEFDARRAAGEYQSDPLVQKEIAALDRRVTDYYQDPGRLSERKVDHTDHVRLMLDIMVLAFWSDSTRIGTFMYASDVTSKNFSFLPGVQGGHHEISHHEEKKEKLAQFTKINTWHIEQYAYMLGKMRSIPEGDGTLLDHSMVLFGCGIRDGNRHVPHNLPIVLAGRGGGSLKTGRHLAYEKDTPLCDLYKSALRHVGAPVERFADSTAELPGLENEAFVPAAKPA